MRSRNRTPNKRKRGIHYKKSKINFLAPYVPKDDYWTIFKFRTNVLPAASATGVVHQVLPALRIMGLNEMTFMQNYFGLFKTVYVDYEFRPNAAMGTDVNGSTAVTACITHENLGDTNWTDPALVYSSILRQRYNKHLNATASDKYLKLRWTCDPTDSSENDFTPCNFAAQPTYGGGFVLFYDGSAAVATKVIGEIFITYTVIFKGRGSIRFNN